MLSPCSALIGMLRVVIVSLCTTNIQYAKTDYTYFVTIHWISIRLVCTCRDFLCRVGSLKPPFSLVADDQRREAVLILGNEGQGRIKWSLKAPGKGSDKAKEFHRILYLLALLHPYLAAGAGSLTREAGFLMAPKATSLSLQGYLP